MVITVDGVIVKINYLKIDRGGYILQLLVTGDGEKESPLHRQIALLFYKVFTQGGVMDKAEVN